MSLSALEKAFGLEAGRIDRCFVVCLGGVVVVLRDLCLGFRTEEFRVYGAFRMPSCEVKLPSHQANTCIECTYGHPKP